MFRIKTKYKFNQKEQYYQLYIRALYTKIIIKIYYAQSNLTKKEIEIGNQ